MANSILTALLAAVALARPVTARRWFVSSSRDEQHASLLLDGTLQTSALKAWGAGVAHTPEADGTDGAWQQLSGFSEVCQRTLAALLADVPEETPPQKLLGGRVYRECAAALVQARSATGRGVDAVDALGVCTALVDALVSELGNGSPKASDGVAACDGLAAATKKEALSTARAGQNGDAADAPLLSFAGAPAIPDSAVTEQEEANAAAPAVTRPAAAKPDGDAELLGALPEICMDTMQSVDAVRTAQDAMKLGGAVAPICEDAAHKRLGSPPAASKLRNWCGQLNGRLVLALEVGALFAFQPESAERSVGQPNPYTSETRGQFCARFVASIRSQASSRPSGAAAAPAAPATIRSGGAAAPPAANRSSAAIVPTAAPCPPRAAPQLALNHPSGAAAPLATNLSSAVVAPSATPRPPGTASPMAAGGEGTFELVRNLSADAGWLSCCQELLEGLNAEEGSVTDASSLGHAAATSGAQVLTFNGADQSGVGRCASRLEAMAVQAGQASPGTGDELGWARDACSDVAHGFLTLQLAQPGAQPAQFCRAYAADLASMRGAGADKPQLPQPLDDMAKLRMRARGRLKHREDMRAAGMVQEVSSGQDDEDGAADGDEGEAEGASEGQGADLWRGQIEG